MRLGFSYGKNCLNSHFTDLIHNQASFGENILIIAFRHLGAALKMQARPMEPRGSRTND